MLTRDAILTHSATAPERAEAFGGFVFIRVLSGTERDAFEQSVVNRRKAGKAPNFRGDLLARAICDESGKRLFTDNDAEALGAQSAVELDRLLATAMKVNGLAATDVKALEGN